MNLEIYSSLAVVAVIPVFFGKYFFLPELNSNIYYFETVALLSRMLRIKEL